MIEQIFKNSNNLIGSMDTEYSIKTANPSFLNYFSLLNGPSKSHRFIDFILNSDRSFSLETLNKHSNHSSPFSFTAKTITTEKEPQSISWEIIPDLTNNQFYFIGTNITSDLKAHYLLEEHTDKLLKIIELVPHPIFLKDSNACYILVNQAQADLFSLSRNEFIGKNDSAFINNEEELIGIRASDSVVLHKQKNVILPAQKITDANGDNKILYTSKIPFQSSVNGEMNILGVSIDITEIKNSESELRKINFELDSFIYHASHDLKAPLCSLEGLFKLINKETDEALRKKCVEEGLKSIKRLDGFITDLTNLSRSNRTEIQPEKIKFKKIITRTLESLKYIPNADRVNILINLEKEIDFYCDKKRMNIIFMNLISNAIKYQNTDIESPALSITIIVTKEFASIEFKDNGIGIEEQYQSKIFEMFFRGTTLSNGSGLGLYILKEILLKLGGTINIISTENIGTSFILKIPNAVQHII